MPSGDSDPTPMRTRILAHMTADHSTSLRLYLQAPPISLPTWQIGPRRPIASDIDNDSLTITLSPFVPIILAPTIYTIAISPPMSSLTEARGRLVAMDVSARTTLGLSDITIDRYIPPKSALEYLVPMAAILAVIAFSSKSNFLPGSFIHALSQPWVPKTFLDFCVTIQPYLIPLMSVIHGAEAIHISRGRLRKHCVPVWGLVWWLWVLSAFVEGLRTFVRFDEAVKVEEEKVKRKKELGKH